MIIKMKREGEWLVGTLTAAEDGWAVRALLRDQWGLPKKMVHLLFQEKGVCLDGRSVTLHDRTEVGQVIKLRVCQPEPYGVEPVTETLRPLYEDDHLLIFNKPAGLMVHPTEPGHRRTLDHMVAGYLQAAGVQTKVRHIHRLDAETSGAILYAKHALAAALLDEALRANRISRRYAAFVHGRVQTDRGTIDRPIGRDRHHPSRRRVSPGGEVAITHFQVIERYRDVTQVQCWLDTGRTHQIRVHLSHLGHPLLGDPLYGGKTGLISRQALHAEALHFTHPFGGETMVVQAPWPEDLTRLREHLR